MFRASLLIAIAVMSFGAFAGCAADPTPTPVPTATPTATPAATPSPTPTAASTATPTLAIPIVPNAVTVMLIPVQDATIWEGGGATASGSGPNLFAGRNNRGQVRRALLRFDLAEVPVGVTVLFASLEMSTNKTPSTGVTAPMSLHRLTASWGEGASNAGSSGAGTSATTGDVTWDWRTFEGDRWAAVASGGDFLPLASVKTVQGRWDSTDALVEDVQAWVDDASANHGWIIVGDERTNQSVRRFDSREGGIAPVLTIAYVPTR